jgi:hypothetical protein
MVVLNFTLTPEAASKIHDLLVCLGKFSDTVAIEARRDRVGSYHVLFFDALSHLVPVYFHRSQFFQISVCCLDAGR